MGALYALVLHVLRRRFANPLPLRLANSGGKCQRDN